jgi:hypothetical protein
MTHQQAVDTLASERYLLGEMTELERHSFEDHYFSCDECAEDVRIGALMQEGAKTAFAGAQRPAGPVRTASAAVLRPARWWSPRSTFIPWAAAAMLALVAGAESLVIAPSLRHESSPEAITPVTLRPASRGAAAIVRPGPSGSVLLAADINGSAAASTLTYELRAPGGAQTASGSVPAPTAGTPLYLLFPTGSLTARGEYILLIRDATSGDRTIGDYRFTVAE